MEATKGIPSPEPFRLWTAITTVAGAMERRTWTEGTAREIFPNLFTLLVGPPATGKTNALYKGYDLWRNLKGTKTAPTNVNKSTLLDAVERSLKSDSINGKLIAYSHLNVAVSEFGVFFANHDLEFLSVMNEIYEGPPLYTEERRTTKNVDITKPLLNIMAGTQPDFLGEFMPEAAWGMGFTSRLIMIYAAKAPPALVIGKKSHHEVGHLLPGLTAINKMYGEFIWPDDVLDDLHAWHAAGAPPAPIHDKLKHYVGRRTIHVIKLAMTSAASRACSLEITMEDLDRARGWLIDAEKTMPDIFFAMRERSDMQIIEDLHFHMYQLWAAQPVGKRSGLDETDITKWLASKVQAYRVQSIFDIAVKSGYFTKALYPDTWTPAPLTETHEIVDLQKWKESQNATQAAATDLPN